MFPVRFMTESNHQFYQSSMHLQGQYDALSKKSNYEDVVANFGDTSR